MLSLTILRIASDRSPLTEPSGTPGISASHSARALPKHVARFFDIAEPTGKAHVKAIFRKIGASNRTQAAIWALNHGHFERLNGVAQDIAASPSVKKTRGPNPKVTVIQHGPIEEEMSNYLDQY